MGAHWVTVHGLNGPECLKELSVLEKKIRRQIESFRVLAVTVLTSFNSQTLPPIWREETIAKSVERLAESAQTSGLSSFVCSPDEVSILRNKYSESFLVVPGVRPDGTDHHDQKRVTTPRIALERGASALVIGRPITESADPAKASRAIAESLK